MLKAETKSGRIAGGAGRAARPRTIARGLGVSQDMSTEAPRSDKEHDSEAQYPEQAWRYKRILTELYHEKGLTLEEIADELGCTKHTVWIWVGRYGLSKGVRQKKGPTHYPTSTEYERWDHQYKNEKWCVKVHRLLAVAEFGFDAVADKSIHHRNDIPWDNRGQNLRPLSHSEHVKWHARARSVGLTPEGDFGQFTDEQIDALLNDETWRDVGDGS